jgi:hypothetical protein
MSGVSQRTISNICNPDGPSPTLESVDAVAAAFGLAGTVQAQTATYTLDPTHTFVTFEALHARAQQQAAQQGAASPPASSVN